MKKKHAQTIAIECVRFPLALSSLLWRFRDAASEFINFLPMQHDRKICHLFSVAIGSGGGSGIGIAIAIAIAMIPRIRGDNESEFHFRLVFDETRSRQSRQRVPADSYK